MKNCKYCSILYGCYSLRIGNSGEDFGIIIQDKHNGHIMLDKMLKFNFCPMCGRKLKINKEDTI